MQNFLEANGGEKRPLHEHAMEHFGLSEAQIKREFAAYRERYILNHQP